MNKDFEFKEEYTIDDLLNIMEILRSPKGCLWDREQNHQSIKMNFIEETYEAVEAINKADAEMLKEELGDVLLQIVFHAQMEKEEGRFDFADVADGICKKLIERHPHIFSDTKVSNTDEVLSNWDEIKRQTKQQKSTAEAMEAVPRELPALMRSTKIQKRAAKQGFDWPDVKGALDKLQEEVDELSAAIREGSADKIADELGDVLFSAVNVSRFVKLDAEDALTAATDKFMARFSFVEKMAAEEGLDISKTDMAILDKLWNQAKIMNKD